MKKLMIIVGILGVALLAYFLLFYKAKNAEKVSSSKSHYAKELTPINIDSTKINKEALIERVKSGLKAQDKKSELSPEQEEIEDIYLKIDEGWRTEISGLIQGELGLDESAINRYFELRDNLMMTKMELNKEMMEAFSGEMRLNADREQASEHVVSRMKEDSGRELKNLFGEEGYIRYLEYKKEFNQKMAEELAINTENLNDGETVEFIEY